MKSYIPHRLLVVNASASNFIDDPVMNECYRLAFDWANEMGRQGKKVFGLRLEKPDEKNYNAMRQHSTLWCQIECTEEERVRWEEMQKFNVQHAVYNLIKEEE